MVNILSYLRYETKSIEITRVELSELNLRVLYGGLIALIPSTKLIYFTII